MGQRRLEFHRLVGVLGQSIGIRRCTTARCPSSWAVYRSEMHCYRCKRSQNGISDRPGTPGSPQAVDIGAGTDATIALLDQVIVGRGRKCCCTIDRFDTPAATQRTGGNIRMASRMFMRRLVNPVSLKQCVAHARDADCGSRCTRHACWSRLVLPSNVCGSVKSASTMSCTSVPAAWSRLVIGICRAG